ncbi:Protein of unknown function [Pyronema omphalodes CBS 100304]|uniref:Uncharacterized protein n=1 Tax=Pyronema omphalodes (strain CBS 100304) TaxID=1076935 RepID=U4L4G9_PYROM|nr:Protein of unknown function [Pyronema omphalodes CBS 100304]
MTYSSWSWLAKTDTHHSTRFLARVSLASPESMVLGPFPRCFRPIRPSTFFLLREFRAHQVPSSAHLRNGLDFRWVLSTKDRCCIVFFLWVYFASVVSRGRQSSIPPARQHVAPVPSACNHEPSLISFPATTSS